MAGKRKAPANGRKKRTTAKAEPELIFEDGYYWIVAGTKRLNAGRNQRYAENKLAEQKQ